MKPEFSIIVPVYNAEKTILKCLKSLRMQTFSSFEVLVIDDGSKDDSLEFCKKIAEEDNRFKVLHQENAGPSSARNAGLAMARGEFIAFVDSDDTVEPNYIERIKEQYISANADVVFIGYTKYSPQGEKSESYIPRWYSTDFFEVLTELFRRDMFGYTWIKSFRKTVVDNIRFRQDINLFEDEIFTCEVLEQCQSIGIVEEPVYNYVCGNQNALMSKTHQDYCELQEQVYCAWKHLLESDMHKKEVLERKANAMVSVCQYYVYERNVNTKDFLHALSKCTFFKESTLENSFSRALHNGHMFKIRRMRLMYQLKVIISKMFK